MSEADHLSRLRICRIFLKSILGFVSQVWSLPLQPLLSSPPCLFPPPPLPPPLLPLTIEKYEQNS